MLEVAILYEVGKNGHWDEGQRARSRIAADAPRLR
jgi:hypothetical protein